MKLNINNITTFKAIYLVTLATLAIALTVFFNINPPAFYAGVALVGSISYGMIFSKNLLQAVHNQFLAFLILGGLLYFAKYLFPYQL